MSTGDFVELDLQIVDTVAGETIAWPVLRIEGYHKNRAWDYLKLCLLQSSLQTLLCCVFSFALLE